MFVRTITTTSLHEGVVRQVGNTLMTTSNERVHSFLFLLIYVPVWFVRVTAIRVPNTYSSSDTAVTRCFSRNLRNLICGGYGHKKVSQGGFRGGVARNRKMLRDGWNRFRDEGTT